MGTRGRKVYRYKGRYYVHYNHCDSYPDAYGVGILHQIPRRVSKEEFEEWLGLIREDLNNSYWNEEDIWDEQPQNDLHIEWIYEIDLDNLVFHINSQPMFRLDNMPPDDVFLRAISFDHFGHRALYEHTPFQYRYDWHAPPPPPPPESLIAYTSYPNTSSTSSIHKLLHTSAALSPIERVRTALMELRVTRCMAEDDVGHDVRVLESVLDRDHIPQSTLELALSLVDFAIGPPIPYLTRNPHGDTWDFIWIRKDVCLRITTHLDDEDNLKASIGDLVHHINTTRDKVGTVYGVACSIFHCAIVRLDKVGEQGTSFSHTPALQFLPSFYARKISTPGIEALSRLGCQSSGVELLTAISEAYNLPRITHQELSATISVAKVPVEVWMNVGHFITSPIDLINLAAISPRAMSAAANLARYPWFKDSDKEFRLVEALGSAPLIPESTEETDQENIRDYHRQMGRTQFMAIEGGRHINVEVGYPRKIAVFRAPFINVKTYLARVAWEKELHVSGPDVDEVLEMVDEELPVLSLSNIVLPQVQVDTGLT